MFAIPGLGSLLVSSIQARDFPTISALTLLFGVLVILVNLARRPRRTRSSTRGSGSDGAPTRRARARPARTRSSRCCARSRSGRGRSGAGACSASGRAWRSSACSRSRRCSRPVLFPGGPNSQDLLNTLQPPSWQHPFGTDNLGRDIFARTIYARRIDLMVGADHDVRAARDRRAARRSSPATAAAGSTSVVMRGRRRRGRVPVHRARDRHDRDRRPGPERRLHRHRRRRLGAVRAADARRDAGAARAASSCSRRRALGYSAHARSCSATSCPT